MSDQQQLAPDADYQPHPDVVFTELNESEAFLLKLRVGSYFALNETGSRIWRALENGTTLAHIAQALEDLYEVEPGQALQYTRDFVGELLQNDLVQPTGQRCS